MGYNSEDESAEGGNGASGADQRDETCPEQGSISRKSCVDERVKKVHFGPYTSRSKSNTEDKVPQTSPRKIVTALPKLSNTSKPGPSASCKPTREWILISRRRTLIIPRVYEYEPMEGKLDRNSEPLKSLKLLMISNTRGVIKPVWVKSSLRLQRQKGSITYWARRVQQHKVERRSGSFHVPARFKLFKLKY